MQWDCRSQGWIQGAGMLGRGVAAASRMSPELDVVVEKIGTDGGKGPFNIHSAWR